jgi:hypothetical protein
MSPVKNDTLVTPLKIAADGRKKSRICYATLDCAAIAEQGKY